MIDIKTRALKYVIDDISHFPILTGYKKLFEQEEFIIYYYLEQMHELDTKLTRALLEKLMETNAPRWLLRNSIIKKKNRDALSRDYLQSKTSDMILTNQDEESALISVVLQKYDEIVALPIKDEEEALKIELDHEYKSLLSIDFLTKIQDLMKTTAVVDGGKTYTKLDLLDYAENLINKYKEEGVQSESSSYLSTISDEYKNAIMNEREAFQWNIGLPTMPPVKLGYLVSLLGPSKTGKTKFAIGEMVYNALVQGDNALILSGEMSTYDMLSFVLVKYMYMKYGLRIDKTIVNLVIGLMENTKLYDISLYDAMDNIDNQNIEDKNLKEYVIRFKRALRKINSIDNNIIEIIILTYNTIVNNTDSKLGKVVILTKDSSAFDMEYFKVIIENKIREEDIKIVLVDHAGLIEPRKGQEKTAAMTEAYQVAKTIAKNKEHPVTVIMVNHVDTKNEDKSGKTESLRNARAFNTNESGKSSDIEIIIWRTDESRREGNIYMFIKYAREGSDIDDDVVLVSDYLVNDFCVPGVNKGDYYEGE